MAKPSGCRVALDGCGLYSIPGLSEFGSTYQPQHLYRQAAQQWDDIERGCYPDRNDTRTRMTAVHGTQDLAVLYSPLGMKLTQWSNVLDVSFTKNMASTPGQTPELDRDGLWGWIKAPWLLRPEIWAYFPLSRGNCAQILRHYVVKTAGIGFAALGYWE